MSSTAAVETASLGKRYRTVWALRDCSLRIPAGSIVALVGPNGAGKSTLLNLLTGLVGPSHGALRVFGEPVSEAVRQRVGFTAQNHPLYQQFSVVDMLRAGRELNPRWDEQGARDRLTGLGIPLRQRIGALSGGQRAQLSLALALAKQPQLLLLDEPVAALDPLARREFMQMLMGVVADGGLTVVLSSHVISELERVCDYLVALHHGHVQLTGAVEDLLAEHLSVTGPTVAAAALHHTQTVVMSNNVGRQTTALIRRGRNPLDPVWQCEPVRLDDLILAYLNYPQASALPGPQALATEASS